MAFKSVMGSQFAAKVKASEMEKGDELVGYLVRTEVRTGGQYGDSYSLILRTDAGDTLVYASGELKNAIKYGRLQGGLMTRIEAKGEEKRKSKSGSSYTITTFAIEQDESQSINVPSGSILSGQVEEESDIDAFIPKGGADAQGSAQKAKRTGGIAEQISKLSKGVANG